MTQNLTTAAETKKKRILTIDDDITMLCLMGMSLEMHGYETLQASNGVEAIEILKHEEVDGIVVDLMMPVMDGLRFVRWLRNEAQLSTPTLVLTSREEPSTHQEVMEAGATLLAFKPIDVSELLNQLQHLLEI